MTLYPTHRPMARCVCFMIGGLLAARYGSWLLLATSSIVLIALGLLSKRSTRRLLFACFFLLGIFLMHHAMVEAQQLVPLHQQKVTAVVQVNRAPTQQTYIDGKVIRLNNKNLANPVSLRLQRPYNDDGHYQPGAYYQFEGTLLEPKTQTNPGGYDEARNLSSRGIFTVLKARSTGVFLKSPSPLIQWILNLKQTSYHAFEKYFDKGEAALLVATLFGDVSGLHQDFYALSQQFGIIHIFSVSGLHVTFILSFILLIARVLRLQHHWLLLLLLIPLLALYCLLSDLSAPAIRASVMAVLFLLALRLHRYRDPISIIALAAFGLLVANPFNLWQIGFQLSFAAMLGIFVLTPPLERLMQILPQGLRTAIAASLAAELVSLPLVAWYFYMVAPLSILMNLLVVPLFSLIVPLSLLGLLLHGLLPALGFIIFFPTKILIFTVVALMNLVNGSLGNGHYYLGQPPWWLLLLYSLLLLSLATCTYYRHWPQLHLRAGILLVAAMVLCFLPYTPSNLRLTVLDVGQGSSAVYQSSQGAWLVLDTGPQQDTTAQYLRYCGVNTLEAIVLSHSDSDHIQGLNHLLRDFHVKQLFITKAAQQSEEWKALSPYLRHSRVTIIDKPVHYRKGNLQLSLAVLGKHAQRTENNNQLICQIDDDHRYLFPGDSSADLLKDCNLPAPVEVLVVPHHGSRYSWDESFYARYNPQLCLISCGRNNRFGHPHAQVTDGLTSMDIPFLRTDQAGAIRLYEQHQKLYSKAFLT